MSGFHRLIGEDEEAVSCLHCGALWLDGREPETPFCPDVEDPIHTYDVSNTGHTLDCDQCAAAVETGDGFCERVDFDCDCDACG